MILHKRLKTCAPALLGLLLATLTAIPAAGLDVPRLKGHVNDYAGMLSPASQRQLEALLTDFEQQESTQIVLLTVPSLEGDSLEDFSMRVAEGWKIGRAETDNGAILLIAKADRKIRIEVGYGLEGRLTDLLSGRIIRKVIAPYFKAGAFEQGIAAGISAMIDAVRGEFSAGESTPPPRPKQTGIPFVPLLAILFLLNALGRASRTIGAVAGGVLAPIAGGLFFGLGPMFLLALIPVGVVAGLLVSLIGGPLTMGHGGIRRGGGGYWGGGFGGGGGFSSGGFGGFSGGGGGFGGGGASGGW
jgi:uncharacterized protein